MEQWVLPLAFIAGMLLLHRFSAGGCCGGHTHQRDSRDHRTHERESAGRAPEESAKR